MRVDLQTALREIEGRAADFGPATQWQATREATAETADDTPRQHSSRKSSLKSSRRSSRPPHHDGERKVKQADRGTSSGARSDRFQSAGKQILRRLGQQSQASLLLLCESPLSACDSSGQQTPGGAWAKTFADLREDPVLAVKIASATEGGRSEMPPLSDTQRRPQIIQSHHPGLCTVQIPFESTAYGSVDEWNQLQQRFGLILIDGSGVDLAKLKPWMARCGNVLFFVDYGKTSRRWGRQVCKQVAAQGITPVGCITQGLPDRS